MANKILQKFNRIKNLNESNKTFAAGAVTTYHCIEIWLSN